MEPAYIIYRFDAIPRVSIANMGMDLYRTQQIRKGRYGRPQSVNEQLAGINRARIDAARGYDGRRVWTRIGGTPVVYSARCADYARRPPAVRREEFRAAIDEFERKRQVSGNRYTMDEEILNRALWAATRAKWAEEKAAEAKAETERASKEAAAAVKQAGQAV